jgi:hypothetical protein
MAHLIVVQSLVCLLLSASAYAKVDHLHAEAYLGEKKFDTYSERYVPLVFQDVYLGKMAFQDELFFQNYFSAYSFSSEWEIAPFLKSELPAGLSCSNELLSEHFDEIRYSYRLITLSYLFEAQWQMQMYANQFRIKDACDFDPAKWALACTPKSEGMKKFLSRIRRFGPRYTESLPPTYKQENWWRELSSGKLLNYPQYRMAAECTGKCGPEDIKGKFAAICFQNKQLMDIICSETDHLMGLSTDRDAYYLIGLSNIINTYNKRGEAMGCLRRFSEVMSHKEVKYRALTRLFPVLQSFLRERHQERFLQGRVFFFGSSKEFEEKGLTDLYVKEQLIKIETHKDIPLQAPTLATKAPENSVALVAKPEEIKATEMTRKPEIVEINAPVKSAFLQAAELRALQNLPKVEVDMLKFKYDYVFTLHMLNTLSERLKTFMTREALTEMATYDKLGTAQGPVPLLFIKYMLDMQEHQGIWNLISILGDKFYVSNEMDPSYKTSPELVQIVNNDANGRMWQIYILKR